MSRPVRLVLLVRGGSRSWRYLAPVGMVIGGTIVPLAARIAFPPLLDGWRARPDRCCHGTDVARG
jgi:hypothetical protein